MPVSVSEADALGVARDVAAGMAYVTHAVEETPRGFSIIVTFLI